MLLYKEGRYRSRCYMAEIMLQLDVKDIEKPEKMIRTVLDTELRRLAEVHDIVPSPATRPYVLMGGSVLDRVTEFKGYILFETDEEFEDAYEWLRDLQRDFKNDHIHIESIAPYQGLWN